MYYQEKLINGVMYYRTSPDGDWRQMSIEKLSRDYSEMKARIADLEESNRWMTSQLQGKGVLV